MARKKEIIVKEEVEEEIIAEESKPSKRKIVPKKQYGTRAEVWHGNASMTTGGLKKSDLMKNKEGVLVSKKKSNMAKKRNIIKRLK